MFCTSSVCEEIPPVPYQDRFKIARALANYRRGIMFSLARR